MKAEPQPTAPPQAGRYTALCADSAEISNGVAMQLSLFSE
jgi:hypothetical protein